MPDAFRFFYNYVVTFVCHLFPQTCAVDETIVFVATNCRMISSQENAHNRSRFCQMMQKTYSDLFSAGVTVS